MDSPKLPPLKTVFEAQDIKALVELRDQLGDYLATIERNTDAVNEWLTANKSRIILFHQKLDRAIRKKDETGAVALIAQMRQLPIVDEAERQKMISKSVAVRSSRMETPVSMYTQYATQEVDAYIANAAKVDIAGFVLSIQDFSAKVETAFGKDNAFQKAIADIAPGLPVALQEPLPEVTFLSGEGRVRAIYADVTKGPMLVSTLPLPGDTVPKKRWPLSGLFNKEEQQRQEEAREIFRQFKEAKADILALQSDRHYYIDSFMDWFVDTMEPKGVDEKGKAPDAAAAMLQYQDPEYVFELANADYRDVVENRVHALCEAALEYAAIASSLDLQQDTAKILGRLQAAYPAEATPTSELLRKTLMEDYQSASLAELILNHVESRESQAQLLSAFFPALLQEKLIFTDAGGVRAVFEKFMQRVLDKKDPLAPTVLFQVLSILKAQCGVYHGVPVEDLIVGYPLPDGKTAFQRIVERFENDISRQTIALRSLLSAMSDKAPTDGVNDCVQFYDSLRKKDTDGLIFVLKNIKERNSALEVLALMQLCHPGFSFFGEIRTVSSNPVTKAALLEQALQAGLLGEIRSDVPDRFAELMERDIFTALDAFPVNVVRQLIAHSFSGGGLEGLRSQLTNPPTNWLEKILTARIDDRRKMEWVAACLEPFKSDVVRANILYEAGGNAGSTTVCAMLSSLEKNLIGDAIRLAEDKILCNLPLIANIWHDNVAKKLCYTVQGRGYTLLDGVETPMAGELLNLIGRRGGFLREEGGLFRPEKIDAICTTPQETSVSWFRHELILNADAQTLAQLHTRPDFLHITDSETGLVSSYNLESVFLVLKLENGNTLLIDKYGVNHELHGTMSPVGKAPLVKIDGVYFNPGAASIMALDERERTLQVRVEGLDFEKFIGSARTAESFYTIDLPPSVSCAALKREIESRADIHTVPDESGVDRFFNMRSLAYVSFKEGSGEFTCRRYSPTPLITSTPVFPSGLDEETLGIIGQDKNIVRVGSLLMHKDSLDDAYFDSARGKLHFMVGDSKIQEAEVTSQEGWGALARLAQDSRFRTVSLEETEAGDMPHDVIHLDRVTTIFRDPHQQQTQVVTGGTSFQVALDHEGTVSLLDALEEEDFVRYHQKNPVFPWTQNIRTALSELKTLEVCASPQLNTETPQLLLKQVFGEVAPSSAPVKSPASKPLILQLRFLKSF